MMAPMSTRGVSIWVVTVSPANSIASVSGRTGSSMLALRVTASGVIIIVPPNAAAGSCERYWPDREPENDPSPLMNQLPTTLVAGRIGNQSGCQLTSGAMVVCIASCWRSKPTSNVALVAARSKLNRPTFSTWKSKLALPFRPDLYSMLESSGSSQSMSENCGSRVTRVPSSVKKSNTLTPREKAPFSIVWPLKLSSSGKSCVGSKGIRPLSDSP